MQAVCRNLAIESGTVVFGHTHVPLSAIATPDGRHELFNSGSWVWDRRLRDGATYRGSAGRAPVLRATGATLELRGLLADCDDRDLAQMLAIQPAPRRHQWARPKLATAPR